jgi:hypothetical protein
MDGNGTGALVIRDGASRMVAIRSNTIMRRSMLMRRCLFWPVRLRWVFSGVVQHADSVLRLRLCRMSCEVQ